MAKKSADKESLVKEALLTIARAEGPLRLTGKGPNPAVVMPKTDKAVVAQLRDPSDPLIWESGKDAEPRVGLTAAGFRMVVGDLADENVGSVARGVAERLDMEVRINFLEECVAEYPMSAVELEPLLGDAVKRRGAARESGLQRERELAERRRLNEAALERCLAHAKSLRTGRIDELRGLLVAVGGTVPDSPMPVPNGSAPPEPVTDEDRDFRRDVAERLVSSWRDAVRYDKADASEYLEAAIENLGAMRRIGEVGESIPFDAIFHADVPGLPTGERVRVTRSGWQLELDHGEYYVIEKALVAT